MRPFWTCGPGPQEYLPGYPREGNRVVARINSIASGTGARYAEVALCAQDSWANASRRGAREFTEQQPALWQKLP